MIFILSSIYIYYYIIYLHYIFNVTIEECSSFVLPLYLTLIFFCNWAEILCNLNLS